MSKLRLVGDDAEIEGGLALERLVQLDQAILDALPVGVLVCSADGKVLRSNRRAAQLAGGHAHANENAGRLYLFDLQGQPIPSSATPTAVALGGEPCAGREVLIELVDGRRLAACITAEPLRGVEGEVIGSVTCIQDITHDLAERRKSEDSQRLLINELNHRVKNTLATVQSLAMQTARDASSPESFQRAFNDRLIAMARAHDLLTRRQWQGVPMSELFAQEFASYSDAQAHAEGPPLDLSPAAALSLSMVVHELAANAAEHGALSAPGGRVTVRWRPAKGSPRGFEIDWREAGGPPVRKPLRRGFGGRLLDMSLRRDLQGSAELKFLPSGLRCHIFGRLGRESANSA